MLIAVGRGPPGEGGFDLSASAWAANASSLSHFSRSTARLGSAGSAATTYSRHPGSARVTCSRAAIPATNSSRSAGSRVKAPVTMITTPVYWVGGPVRSVGREDRRQELLVASG